jgi:Biotin carboxyl carrier protein
MTSPPSTPDPRAELVRQLALLLTETDLNEIELTDGALQIRVARSTPPPVPIAAAGAAISATIAPATAIAPSAPAQEENPHLSHPGLVTSPMVGVVYTSPEPDAPAFAGVGDTVAVGATLLLIEAMKVFNPITAPRAGRVIRMFVTNGTPVEYGEPLLVIE